ncbi:MAG: RluA family pseudouridine synthase [Bacillota bacterium]|nr:RluA family pseudouridine synthase [Bacillota bacterium]
MREYSFTVEREQKDLRLDVLLAALSEELSRSYVQRLIGEGLVRINGETAPAKNYRVREGDTVFLRLPEPETLSAEPEDIPLEILYEDGDLLVVDKPKGMVVHPAAGNPSGTLVNALLHHCGGRLSTINGVVRPGIVHRIDKDTAGLLVVAKNDEAHRKLAAQMEAHSITRIYEAVVHDNIPEEAGTIDKPIGRDPGNRLRWAVAEGGRRAVTHFKVLERFGRFTYVELRLETGRTHQIRVHMASLRHPLAGDPLYGPAKGVKGLNGQLLHAGTLGFVHPSSGEYMEFHSPLPEDFAAFLEKLRAGR